MLSNLFSLNLKDLFKGLVTAIFGAVITYLLGVFGALYQLVINNQPFQININWGAVLVIGIFAGLSYLSTRFFSGTTGNFLSK